MDGGQAQLRDRMLRHAIVEVLRGPCGVSDEGRAISLVDDGLIGHVIVEGARVRVELALPPKRSPLAGALAAEVRRRVQALPEVTLAEVSVRRLAGTAAATTTPSPQATGPRRKNS